MTDPVHPSYTLTARDVARRLRTTPAAVLRLARAGVLPCRETPGEPVRRFREADVRAYLARRDGGRT